MGNLSRRAFSLGAAFLALASSALSRVSPKGIRRRLILAPSSLGLRPETEGHVPGTRRAPAALLAAGLQAQIGAETVVPLPEPKYQFGAQPGTRIRNGNTIRSFSLSIGDAVYAAIEDRRFAVVVGGDCSILLGGLYGLRRSGGRGLVHIDGHSDFVYPATYDTKTRLGAVAGMDLALATGRGEALLTEWPGVEGPLVREEDAIQIGERNSLDPDYDKYYGDLVRTPITRLVVQDVLKMGIPAAANAALVRMAARNLNASWMHLDLDVLDQVVMPAVDSPGSPGLDFAQLSELVGRLLSSGRFRGVTVAIYDPEKDPGRRYAHAIVKALGDAFRLAQAIDGHRT